MLCLCHSRIRLAHLTLKIWKVWMPFHDATRKEGLGKSQNSLLSCLITLQIKINWHSFWIRNPNLGVELSVGDDEGKVAFK